MVEQTTITEEVGDKEYEVTIYLDGSTDVEEVVDEPFLVAESDDANTFGFKIPLSDVSPETVDVTTHDKKWYDEMKYYVAWDTDVDVSDWKDDGKSAARVDGFDGHAQVSEVYVSDE